MADGGARHAGGGRLDASPFSAGATPRQVALYRLPLCAQL